MKKIIEPGDRVRITWPDNGHEGYFQAWGMEWDEDDHLYYTVAVVLFDDGIVEHVIPSHLKLFEGGE